MNLPHRGELLCKDFIVFSDERRLFGSCHIFKHKHIILKLLQLEKIEPDRLTERMILVQQMACLKNIPAFLQRRLAES